MISKENSSNFSKFDITKPCALCGNPGHTFNNCHEVTNPKLKECYIRVQLACNRFRKSIDDLGIQNVHTIASVGLSALEQMAETQVNSLTSTQSVFNIDTHHHQANNSNSPNFVSAVSSLSSKIDNFPNAIVAALAGTARGNSDTDSDIGG